MRSANYQVWLEGVESQNNISQFSFKHRQKPIKSEHMEIKLPDLNYKSN